MGGRAHIRNPRAALLSFAPQCGAVVQHQLTFRVPSEVGGGVAVGDEGAEDISPSNSRAFRMPTLSSTRRRKKPEFTAHQSIIRCSPSSALSPMIQAAG